MSSNTPLGPFTQKKVREVLTEQIKRNADNISCIPEADDPQHPNSVQDISELKTRINSILSRLGVVEGEVPVLTEELNSQATSIANSNTSHTLAEENLGVRINVNDHRDNTQDTSIAGLRTKQVELENRVMAVVDLDQARLVPLAGNVGDVLTVIDNDAATGKILAAFRSLTVDPDAMIPAVNITGVTFDSIRTALKLNNTSTDIPIVGTAIQHVNVQGVTEDGVGRDSPYNLSLNVPAIAQGEVGYLELTASVTINSYGGAAPYIKSATVDGQNVPLEFLFRQKVRVAFDATEAALPAKAVPIVVVFSTRSNIAAQVSVEFSEPKLVLHGALVADIVNIIDNDEFIANIKKSVSDLKITLQNNVNALHDQISGEELTNSTYHSANTARLSEYEDNVSELKSNTTAIATVNTEIDSVDTKLLELSREFNELRQGYTSNQDIYDPTAEPDPIGSVAPLEKVSRGVFTEIVDSNVASERLLPNVAGVSLISPELLLSNTFTANQPFNIKYRDLNTSTDQALFPRNGALSNILIYNDRFHGQNDVPVVGFIKRSDGFQYFDIVATVQVADFSSPDNTEYIVDNGIGAKSLSLMFLDLNSEQSKTMRVNFTVANLDVIITVRFDGNDRFYFSYSRTGGGVNYQGNYGLFLSGITARTFNSQSELKTINVPAFTLPNTYLTAQNLPNNLGLLRVSREGENYKFAAELHTNTRVESYSIPAITQSGYVSIMEIYKTNLKYSERANFRDLSLTVAYVGSNDGSIVVIENVLANGIIERVDGEDLAEDQANADYRLNGRGDLYFFMRENAEGLVEFVRKGSSAGSITKVRAFVAPEGALVSAFHIKKTFRQIDSYNKLRVDADDMGVLPTREAPDDVVIPLPTDETPDTKLELNLFAENTKLKNAILLGEPLLITGRGFWYFRNTSPTTPVFLSIDVEMISYVGKPYETIDEIQLAVKLQQRDLRFISISSLFADPTFLETLTLPEAEEDAYQIKATLRAYADETRMARLATGGINTTTTMWFEGAGISYRQWRKVRS